MNFKKLELIEKQTVLNVNQETLFWRQFKNPILIKEHAAIQSISFQLEKPNAFALSSSTRVQLYDSKTLTLKKTISRFSDTVYACTLRPDGKLLAASDASSLIQLFDVNSRAILRSLKEHNDAVRCVRFMQDYNRLVSCSDDKCVKVWDLATQTSLSTYTHHTDYVRTADVSMQNAHLFVTGSMDSTINLFDTRTKEPVMTIKTLNPVNRVLLFPNTTMIACASENTLSIYDLINGGKMITTLTPHQKQITTMEFTQNAKRIMTGSLDGSVKIVDCVEGKVIHSQKYASPVLSLGLSKEENLLVVGMSCGTIALRKRTPSLQTPKLKEEKSRNGTRAFYERGKREQVHAGDIVFVESKRVKFTQYEKFLKGFMYGKALDAVLTTNRRPEIVVAMIQELQIRDGLQIAIGGRDDIALEPLLVFIHKHAFNPIYSGTLLRVVEMVLEMYGGVIGKSQNCADIVGKIKQKVLLEMMVQVNCLETLGMLETLKGASL